MIEIARIVKCLENFSKFNQIQIYYRLLRLTFQTLLYFQGLEMTIFSSTLYVRLKIIFSS